MYADDTQLYFSFKPGEVNAQDEAIRAMEDYIKDIRNWLIESRLLLNDDKTEFLVIGTRQQLSKLSPSVLHVGDHTINHSVSVRNLGSVFDNSLSMDSHINQLCKTAFYHIHNISKNSNHLLQESLKSVCPKISRIVRQKRKNEFYLIWPKEPIWYLFSEMTSKGSIFFSFLLNLRTKRCLNMSFTQFVRHLKLYSELSII